MSYYAKVENGIVTQVISAEADFFDSFVYSGRWIKTSYNTRRGVHYDPDTGEPSGKPALRGNYAGIGMIYDDEGDAFYSTQPYPSWTLDKTIWAWIPPTPRPVDGAIYEWDEENLRWIQVSPPFTGNIG
jgi:hypothetical protein